MGINVAIDGPAGAGKSSVSRAAAHDLGFVYIDTGALYRTVALNTIRNGIDTSDAEAVTAAMKKANIEIKYENGEQHLFLNGSDVSGEIRTNEVSMAASDVAKIPAVRDGLLDLQRSLAGGTNAIMDGRDIGTRILPDADVKIFLTASVDSRAKRRYDQYAENGIAADIDEIKADIQKRDEQDATRAAAPLKMADDAVLLDTSDMPFDAVVAYVKTLIEKAVESRSE